MHIKILSQVHLEDSCDLHKTTDVHCERYSIFGSVFDPVFPLTLSLPKKQKSISPLLVPTPRRRRDRSLMDGRPSMCPDLRVLAHGPCCTPKNPQPTSVVKRRAHEKDNESFHFEDSRRAKFSAAEDPWHIEDLLSKGSSG